MASMEAKRSLWATATIVLIFLGWLCLELKFERQIDYNWYDYLVNSTTGARMRPNELLDVEKRLLMLDWYVNATDSLERLHDLEYGVNFGTGIENDQEYWSERDLLVSGWPVANGTSCGQHLDWIRQRLSTGESYGLVKGQLGQELTQLMDSFGKPESGFFSGTIAWPGSYERCLKTSLDNGRIRTRYCWLRFRPKSWPRREPVRPLPRVRVGVCLPETCDTLAFASHNQTIEWLAKLDLNEFHRQNLEAESMFCLPDERSPIRQIPLAGRLYWALLLAWFSLVLLCSIAYERTKKTRYAQAQLTPAKTIRLGQTKTQCAFEQTERTQCGRRFNLGSLLEAMSIHCAIKRFKANPFAESARDSKHKFRLDMSSLNALKFLMAIMIVLGHSVYLTARFTRTNETKLLLGTQMTGLVVLSIGRFVDTFFLLFGLFATYTLLRKVPIEKLASPTTWLAFNLNILIRLMPLILPIYYYAQLVSVYVSHGPWWDYGLFPWTMKGHCLNEPWWKVFPMAGYVGRIPGVACMPVNWFLVVYTQLALIIPLLAYCLCKLPNQLARLALLAYIALISGLFIALKMINQTTLSGDSLGVYGALLIDLLEKFESFGVMKSLGRASCITIGCYVGYLLRQYEVEAIRKWPKWFRSKLTLSIVLALNVLLFLLPIIGNKLAALSKHRIGLNEFIAGFLVTSLIWAVLNSLLIVQVVTTYNHTAIVRFFGHSFWHSTNKLGLGIFLVHLEVIYTTATGYEQGPSFGFQADFWKLFAYALLISVLLAFVLHIFIEAPVNALIDLVYQGRRTTLKRPTELNGVEVVAVASLPSGGPR